MNARSVGYAGLFADDGRNDGVGVKRTSRQTRKRGTLDEQSLAGAFPRGGVDTVVGDRVTRNHLPSSPDVPVVLLHRGRRASGIAVPEAVPEAQQRCSRLGRRDGRSRPQRRAICGQTPSVVDNCDPLAPLDQTVDDANERLDVGLLDPVCADQVHDD
jgi:hypothetical protein